jgi:hypothetical protein
MAFTEIETVAETLWYLDQLKKGAIPPEPWSKAKLDQRKHYMSLVAELKSYVQGSSYGMEVLQKEFKQERS